MGDYKIIITQKNLKISKILLQIPRNFCFDHAFTETFRPRSCASACTLTDYISKQIPQLDVSSYGITLETSVFLSRKLGLMQLN